MAVVDVSDALISRRVYKLAFPMTRRLESYVMNKALISSLMWWMIVMPYPKDLVTRKRLVDMLWVSVLSYNSSIPYFLLVFHYIYEI